MSNIFENAKFGDRFKTRDGKMALFVCLICGKVAELIIDGEHFTRKFYLNGINFYGIKKTDIIGKWEEPIDEEDLDKLAIDGIFKVLNQDYFDGKISFNKIKGIYKAAYRKAKGE